MFSFVQSCGENARDLSCICRSASLACPEVVLQAHGICTLAVIMEAAEFLYSFTSLHAHVEWTDKYISQIFFLSSLKFHKPRVPFILLSSCGNSVCLSGFH